MGFFVRLNDPVAARRKVLESDKDVLHALKGYYALVAVRERKRQTVLELRRAMKDLHTLIEEVEKLVPEQHLKGLEEYLPKEKKERTKKTEGVKKEKGEKRQELKAAAKRRPLTEQERLEQALSNIEQRLNRL